MKEVDAEADEAAKSDAQENQDIDGGNPDGTIREVARPLLAKMSKNSEARAPRIPVPHPVDAIAYPI